MDRGNFSASLDLSGQLLVGAATLELVEPFHGRIDELAFYDLSELAVEQIEAQAAEMAQRHIQVARRQTNQEAATSGRAPNRKETPDKQSAVSPAGQE